MTLFGDVTITLHGVKCTVLLTLTQDLSLAYHILLHNIFEPVRLLLPQHFVNDEPILTTTLRTMGSISIFYIKLAPLVFTNVKEGDVTFLPCRTRHGTSTHPHMKKAAQAQTVLARRAKCCCA